MCGIIGSINYSKNFDEKNFEWVNSKIKKLKHRGPDDKKIWISDLKNIIFGHRYCFFAQKHICFFTKIVRSCNHFFEQTIIFVFSNIILWKEN